MRFLHISHSRIEGFDELGGRDDFTTKVYNFYASLGLYLSILSLDRI